MAHEVINKRGRRLPAAFLKNQAFFSSLLVDSCLDVLPDNNDLYASRQRLMDWTNKDPSKYQEAHVAYKKLEAALKQSESQESALLLEQLNDGGRLKGLLPYHPDLDAAYKQLQARAARQNADKIGQSKLLSEDAVRLLGEAAVAQSEEKIKEALALNPDNAQAKDLKRSLAASRQTKRLALKPEKSGKKIYIMKSDMLTIGRDQTDIEIMDERVSRRHLKISMMEDSVIAEDLGSANGTKLRGNPLVRSRLEDGDILNLGGAVQYQAMLFSAAALRQAPTILAGARDIVAPSPGPKAQGRPLRGLALVSDAHDVICVEDEVSCQALDIGLVFEKDGPCRFAVSDGVLLFITPQEGRILHPGAVLEYKGLRYRAFEKV